MAVEIETLRDSHAKGIAALMADLYERAPQATWFPEKPDDEQLADVVSQKLASHRQEKLVDNVALLNGEVIGDCEILIDKSTGLLGIAVDSRYQRSGVGRSLLLKSLREARLKNVKLVIAEVQQENQSVLGFFMKHGFALDNPAPVSVEKNGKSAKVIRLTLNL